MSGQFRIAGVDSQTCPHNMTLSVACTADGELVEAKGGKGTLCTLCGALEIDGTWHRPSSVTAMRKIEEDPRT